MKLSKKLGFTNILLVIGIVVAVIIIGSLFLIKQNRKENSYIPAPTNVPTTSTPRSSIQWKSYTNDFLKFSLEYPENWLLDTSGTFTTIVNNINKNDPGYFKVLLTRTQLLESQTIEDFIKDPQIRRNSKILSQQSISVDGKTGEKIIIQDKVKETIIYLKRVLDEKNFVYIISATPADSELMPIFDQMLRTFKFLP